MVTLGRYVLERRIAAGGMAEVFMARMIGAYGFEKRVALKLLKREVAEDEEHVKMFVREALVAAEFRHPNLAQVYEVNAHEEQLFIAMELVRGVSLSALLRLLAEKGAGMPLNAALRIATDALEGLAIAHEATDANDNALGLVHRDVSPQNLMVGVDGVTKVVDFGIARAEAAFGRTIAPRVKGKFSYMAPEQWQAGGALDARADLFALGVVLYELTTGGAKLFKGDGARELFRAVMTDPIPPPSARVQGYPPALETVILRALERDPNLRYPTARAMREALLDVARAERWNLGNSVVASLVRQAVGTREIETLWPLLSEEERPAILAGHAVGTDASDNEVTKADAPSDNNSRLGEHTVAIPLAGPRASQNPANIQPKEPFSPALIESPTPFETPRKKQSLNPDPLPSSADDARDEREERPVPRALFAGAGFAVGLAVGAFAAMGLMQWVSR
ncbi:MAG: serine/threonine-protein kinase [Deltaproteobacteria bacterium]|nr:serine/threonine-protein kinase [Deltaproteobacteria bacterium]